MAKKTAPRNLPEDVSKLIELIISEIKNPVDFQNLLEQLPATTNCAKEANEFLRAKDRFQRREAFIKTEALWFNKYGWFMARVVTLFGLLVIVFAILSRGAGVDFITFAIMGAAGYYALLMTLSNWRYRDKNKKRLRLLERERERYQREIGSVASSLFKRFKVDPLKHPVTNPKSAAGLEEREGGYYIRVD